MDIFSALAGAVESAFRFANTRETHKYADKVLELRLERENELAKPEDEQSDLTIITCERKLLVHYRTLMEFKPPGK